MTVKVQCLYRSADRSEWSLSSGPGPGPGPGAVMAEALVMSSVCRQSTTHSEAHLSGGEGLLEEGGANLRSEYCKESLTRGGEELSFEELRAERYQQRKQREMEEKLRTLTEVKQQLSLELEEKKKELMVMRRRSRRPPIAGSVDLELIVSFPLSRTCSDQDLDHRGGTGQTQSRPDSLRPESRTSEMLSPTKYSGMRVGSAGDRSALGEDQDIQDQEKVDQNQEREEVDQDWDQGVVDQAASDLGDPSHPDVRRRLLELCDVTSCPDCHSELRPLPAVEENSCLCLGGVLYHIYSTILEGNGFSVFKGATEQDYALLKVDSSSVLWDFHQLTRLRTGSLPEGLPLISCFLFVDGSITVYTTPPGHMFTDLVQSVSSDSVGFRAVALLRLVSELDSCRLVHGALQPPLLTCCHRGFHLSDWVLPVDWSSSVDLDLQPDVTSVQQLPSAQTYISLGLLEPTAPPQLVDLVGVAETVHLLLTNSRMVPVQDASGWTAQDFSGDEPCDMYTRMWRRFFRSLLNPGGRSPRSILSELKDQLTSLYQ
ncbi:uncharacterized protein bub1ba isoform X2 [Mugil cephalus]|uniref:uncharacterized protein bub1ba isoform X2 n=1 Tax=Mugil cephalus TaxID=48193 RepID=UPI001FB6023D|nr:uncharacterized protein bub1ba isoform X2 [Mugil cephalus]